MYANVFNKMTANARDEDHFMVAEMPTRLQPWANHDHRIVEKVLKQGVTSDLVHLNLPPYKRGDEKILREMVEAKKAGFLKNLDGRSVNPYKEITKWNNIHAMYEIERLHRDACTRQPVTPPTQASPIEPATPNDPVFNFNEEQVISCEKPARSPQSEDFDMTNRSLNLFEQSVILHDGERLILRDGKYVRADDVLWSPDSPEPEDL